MSIIKFLISLCLLSTLLFSADLSLSVVKEPGKAPVITAHGVGPGYVHVAYSNDLTNWIGFAAALNVFAATNTYSWCDPFASNAPARFYRASYQYTKPVFTNSISVTNVVPCPE